ncbi:hypothetical protein BDW66DRAFT_128352 [Aspergillus desertorum]
MTVVSLILRICCLSLYFPTLMTATALNAINKGCGSCRTHYDVCEPEIRPRFGDNPAQEAAGQWHSPRLAGF